MFVMESRYLLRGIDIEPHNSLPLPTLLQRPSMVLWNRGQVTQPSYLSRMPNSGSDHRVWYSSQNRKLWISSWDVRKDRQVGMNHQTWQEWTRYCPSLQSGIYLKFDVVHSISASSHMSSANSISSVWPLWPPAPMFLVNDNCHWILLKFLIFTFKQNFSIYLISIK